MTQPRTPSLPGVSDRNQTEKGTSGTVTALFVVGLTLVAVNSALYFFGVHALSHPAVSVLALTLLIPRYLRER